jgi:probable phosphoglycerate mutase
MAAIYIMRHAEKAAGDYFNPRLHHQDEPLSDRGRQEAERLCPYFAQRKPSAVYVSEYQRTSQTIRPSASRLHLQLRVDARLNEIDNGRLDALTDLQIQQAYPEVWLALRQRSHDFRFPGGETGAEAQARIVEMLEEKRAAHAAEDILLVSHEGLMRLVMCYVAHLPVYQRGNFQVDLCGVMEIAYQPEYRQWKLIRFNERPLAAAA